MSDTVLRALGVSKSFGEHAALRDVSLDLHRGEVLCMLGRSGSGKTTLLRCMNLLEKPDRGAVLLNGELLGYEHQGDALIELPNRVVARQRRHLGMVFQHFNLFPHRTALENVTEGPVHVLHESPKVAQERGMELLTRVGLADRTHYYPGELSGGQQQRVAIARVLAMSPQVLLFDEPTSALDPEMVNEVLQVIRSLVEEGRTIMIVTHEVGFAREVCNRFVFMQDGQLVEEGSPEQLLSGAQHIATREFLSKVL